MIVRLAAYKNGDKFQTEKPYSFRNKAKRKFWACATLRYIIIIYMKFDEK